MSEILNHVDHAIKILIVEDSPTQAEQLRFILEEKGYRVKHAINGRQALLCLDEYKPLLIITDIVMPEISGYVLCKRIKANESTRDIPVIILTSLSDPNDVIEGIACGADGFITKPYNKEYMLEHIERTLSIKSSRPNEREGIEGESSWEEIQSKLAADPKRMLGLLLSIYDAAVQRNNELIITQNEMSSINENLEYLVEKRTYALSAEIAERIKIEIALRESEERYRFLFEYSGIAISYYSPDGTIISYNKKAGKNMVSQVENFTNRSIYDAFSKDDADFYMHRIEKSLSSDSPQECENCIILDVGLKWFSNTISRIMDRKGEIVGVQIASLDITKRKENEEELKYLGYHDILTGLYNRTFLEEEIKRLGVDRQLPFSILMGDINGLKLINDSFGHETGDRTIVEVANIIKSSCREDDIVARVGGDEFCILLPKTDEETAQKLCKQIYTKCEQYNERCKTGISFISVSLGYTCRTASHESVEVIMQEAEAAMYKHKLLETRSLRSSIVSSIISVLRERYIETDAHSERMKKLSREIGVYLSVPNSMLDDLELLAALHDIGKISISDTIINKNAKLTQEEMEEMKRHSEIGYTITQSTIEFQQISEYILAHHEKWDGSGYPRKLKGKDIPLLSRIISVVDAYDAMTNHRPYRQALSQEEAISEIRTCAGTQFDPEIARIFVEKVLGKAWE